MKLRLKSKGMTELLAHGGEGYAMVLEERKLNAREKIATEEADSDDEVASNASSQISFAKLAAVMSCEETVKMAQEKMYALIAESVNDKVLKKLERRCDGDGMKAWELLETWYGVQANQTHKVLKLKNEMLQLKADAFEDFVDYMDQLMAVQSKLEKMGKGVDGDIIIMLITNQIPEEYNQIITILSQKIGEGEGIDVQEWMDVVEAHVNVVDSKNGPKEKRSVTIASRANPTASHNVNDNCFYCGESGHIKRNCMKWIAKKRSYAEKCEYCDENGHLVKDCPLIVPLDKKLVNCSF